MRNIIPPYHISLKNETASSLKTLVHTYQLYCMVPQLGRKQYLFPLKLSPAQSCVRQASYLARQYLVLHDVCLCRCSNRKPRRRNFWRGAWDNHRTTTRNKYHDPWCSREPRYFDRWVPYTTFWRLEWNVVNFSQWVKLVRTIKTLSRKQLLINLKLTL